MKACRLIILLVTAVAGLPKWKRQGVIEGTVYAQPNRVLEEKPRHRSDAKRSIVRWGPYTLPALSDDYGRAQTSNSGPIVSILGGMDPNGFIISEAIRDGLCVDCTVLAGTADITYADGRRANVESGLYTHHLLLFDQTRKPPEFVSFCPARYDDVKYFHYSPFGSTFLGGAVDEFTTWYTSPDQKLESGYYLNNNTFILQSEVVNYLEKPQEVYLTLDYEWLPGKVGKDAMSTLLTVTGCARQPGFNTIVAQANITSEDFPILGNGRIVNARGHLHDGGTTMQLRLNGNEICSSTATYGGPGGVMKMNGSEWDTISRMSECTEAIPVKRGDYLSLSAIYDTDAHPLRESMGEKMEEMGIFFLSFVTDGTPPLEMPENPFAGLAEGGEAVNIQFG